MYDAAALAIYLGLPLSSDVEQHSVTVKRVHEMGQIRDLGIWLLKQMKG